MAWHGTVTCSHCYQRGHNKRKCPQLTQELKEQYERQMKRVEHYRSATDEDLAKRGEDREWNITYHEGRAAEARKAYLKRTKIDLGTGKKVTNKAAKAERMKRVTCGYCGHTGHTRRVCQNAKNDYKIFVERTKQTRTEWLEKFKASGFGLGSLVIAKRRGYRTDGQWGDMTITGLVSSIDWNGITAHEDNPHVFALKTSDDMKGVSGYNRQSLAAVPLTISEHQSFQVIPSGVVSSPPDNWMGDMPPIKEVFDTKEQRPWAYKWADDKWHQAVRDDLGLPKDAYEV
jgi:hypothetical protein